jgi:hypothetical protein
MSTIHVFDPAMCCSTGICGPSVDPKLVRFAADLDWLKSHGTTVQRFNLSQEPGAFVAMPGVKSALETRGEEALPVIVVDGEVKSVGLYPSREELASWAHTTAQTTPPAADAAVPGTPPTATFQTRGAPTKCC